METKLSPHNYDPSAQQRANYMPALKEIVRKASLERVQQWWLGWMNQTPAWVDSSWRFRLELRKRLRGRVKGIKFLKHHAQTGEARIRYQALIDLSDKRIVDDEIMAILTAAFHDPDLPVKLGALSGLCQLERYPLDRNQIEALVEKCEGMIDRDIGTRAFIYLVRAFPGEAKERLRRGAKSSNPHMRIKPAVKLCG
jgi:hypothetical protein